MLSKHLLIGGGAIALSFISLITGISASSATDVATAGDGAKTMLGLHVIAADRALQPLVAVYAAEAATNPFTMKRAEIRTTRLSFPPPPPLELPALPTLPISER